MTDADAIRARRARLMALALAGTTSAAALDAPYHAGVDAPSEDASSQVDG